MTQVPSFPVVQPELPSHKQAPAEVVPALTGRETTDASPDFRVTREVTFQPQPGIPEQDHWRLSPTGTRLATALQPETGKKQRRGLVDVPSSRPQPIPPTHDPRLPIAYVASNGTHYVWQPKRGGWVVSKKGPRPLRELPLVPGMDKAHDRNQQAVALFRSIRTFFTRKKRPDDQEEQNKEKEREGRGGGHGGGGHWIGSSGSAPHHHHGFGFGHGHGHGIGSGG